VRGVMIARRHKNRWEEEKKEATVMIYLCFEAI
jgi:hypothetical protein